MPPVDTSPHHSRDTRTVVCLGETDGLADRLRAKLTDIRSIEPQILSSPDAVVERLDDSRNPPACVVVTAETVRDPLGFTARVREARADLPVVLCVDRPDDYDVSAVFEAGVTDVLAARDIEDTGTVREVISRAAANCDRRRRHRRDSTILDSMLEELPVHLFVKDDQGRYIRASDELHDPDELLGKTDAELWPDQTESDEDAAVIETGESMLNREVFCRDEDGWFLTSKAAWHDSEGATGLVGLSIDITARKEREQLFRDTSRLLRAIVHASPVPIVVHDENGVVQLWNDAAEELFGWPAAEVIGERIPPFVPHDSEGEFESLIDRVLSEGSVSGIEVRRRSREGETLDLQLSAATVEPVEADRRVVGILSDVTKLKERERRLRRQNQRIEAFTAILAHDLRNPIQVLGGQLEAADDPNIDSAAVDRALDRIEAIIDDVLALAREAPIVETTEPIRLSAVAHDAWREDPAASLTVEDDCRFEANGPRFRRLLTYLYENTIEHGWDGETPVTIRVGTFEDGLYVADDGAGISDADEGQVLEPGYSTTPGGTGYGLNVVQEIAAAHGWGLRIIEADAGGVRVEITGVETQPVRPEDHGVEQDR